MTMVNKFNSQMLRDLIENSQTSERGRAVTVLHPSSKKGFRVMVNCMQPRSYMQAHKHSIDIGEESWILLQGKLALLLFNEVGEVVDVQILSSTENLSVTISSNTYHTAIVLEENTVIYEISDGPYDAAKYKEFAEFAPAEGDEKSEAYFKKLVEECKKVDVE